MCNDLCKSKCVLFSKRCKIGFFGYFFIGMNILRFVKRICRISKSYSSLFKNCCLLSKIAHENPEELLNDYLYDRYMCSVCEQQSQESVQL